MDDNSHQADDLHAGGGTDSLRVPLLDVDVTPMTSSGVVSWIDETQSKSLLLNHNLHSCYLFQTDAGFRQLYITADRVVIDGAPLLRLAQFAGAKGLSADYRIGSTDWIAALDEAQEPGRLFVFGATAASNMDAVDYLRKLLGPRGWEVDGVDGYVNEYEALVLIKGFEPSLVLVGLGMPLQERFLSSHWENLPDAVYATVGGAIDYVGGSSRLAPRWMGPLGIEWMWRLLNDPARLWRRYLWEPFKLVTAIARNRFRASKLDGTGGDRRRGR